MLYLGEARRPNFVSPPAHDLALRLAEASDVWARVLVGVSCSILLELNATWSPEEIECHRTLVSTRAEGLIATIKFLNDINREQASQRERTISELQYCMELKECIGNVTEIFTIGYLGAQIAANMHHLLVLHLDWPDLSALAHLHAYGDLKGWRPPPGCDMGFCDEFENLLFLNGRPRSIEACKVGLRMWIRGRRAQEVYNGRASHLTPCLFKKLLEREYREQGDLPIRHRLALAIQRSLGPAILLQLQLDWDLHRYPSLLDIWQALMTATHSSRVSQSAEVIYRVLSKGMDAKSVLDAFGQDFSRRWLSRMGARLGENDIEANANHLAALFGEGHI